MISKKDNLASLIFDLADNEVSVEDSLNELQDAAKDSKYPKFEVRTVGPNVSLLIKVPNQEWVKPLEWAINHRNTIENKMKEDLERLVKTFYVKPDLSSLGYYTEDEMLTGVTEKVEALLHGLEASDSVRSIVEDNYVKLIEAMC